MKKIALVLMVIMQMTIFAQTPFEVKSLDSQRNCWYQFFEETQTLQLADFAGLNPVALRLSMLDLVPNLKDGMYSVVNNFVSKIELKGEFESYLFCNAGGHVLIVNSYQSIPPVVYTTRIDELDKGELYLGSPKPGFNMGASAHTLMIKHKKNILSEHYKTLIKSFFSEQIAAIRFIPNSNIGRLRVLPQYYFKLLEIKELIEAHPVVSTYTEYLELSTNQAFSGEYGLLFKGKFE